MSCEAYSSAFHCANTRLLVDSASLILASSDADLAFAIYSFPFSQLGLRDSIGNLWSFLNGIAHKPQEIFGC